MTKKHLVFDLDDTLTDAYGFNQQMFVDTFPLLLKKLSGKQEEYLRELHHKSRGQPMLAQFRKAAEYLQLDADPQKLIDINEQLHKDNISQVKLFEGVNEFVRQVKMSGKKISICTNRQSASLKVLLDKNKLFGELDEIVSCADMGHEKPDPYCLLKLIKGSGMTKDEFVYFGDSETDAKFATNAGIDFVILDHYLNKGKFFQVINNSFLK